MKDSFKDTITIEDAVRITGPRDFSIMVKPAGSLCNLDCSYCYYLDKAEIYGGREPRMTLEMLETVIREYVEANDSREIMFNWHGGEPLVLGLDFYRKAVEFERKYAPDRVIRNTVQTNATLVDREWARFFKDNGFLLGVSVDGPEDIHDKFRKDKGGAPTFARVMKGLETLAAEDVPFNTMSTINSCCEGRGLEVYHFLKGIGSRYMQFMPVVEHVKYPVVNGREDRKARPYIVDPQTEGARIARWSVSPVAFGRFVCDIFDEWIRNDVGSYFVNLFDATLANWCGATPGLCVYCQTCGACAVIEHNGDVYPCDHFVYPKYLLGNIREKKLRDMIESDASVRFGIAKRNALPRKCRSCKYLFACAGECPKHRFNSTENGETGLNALCEGYYMFYSRSAPYMERMRDLLAAGAPPALVMPWARMRRL